MQMMMVVAVLVVVVVVAVMLQRMVAVLADFDVIPCVRTARR